MTELKTLNDLKLKPEIIKLPNGETVVKVYPIISKGKLEKLKVEDDLVLIF